MASLIDFNQVANQASREFGTGEKSQPSAVLGKLRVETNQSLLIGLHQWAEVNKSPCAEGVGNRRY
jgi:hypothetical protein